jgi:hypothetical protein
MTPALVIALLFATSMTASLMSALIGLYLATHEGNVAAAISFTALIAVDLTLYALL